MTILELIDELRECMDAHGNIEVEVRDFDEGGFAPADHLTLSAKETLRIHAL